MCGLRINYGFESKHPPFCNHRKAPSGSHLCPVAIINVKLFLAIALKRSLCIRSIIHELKVQEKSRACATDAVLKSTLVLACMPARLQSLRPTSLLLLKLQEICSIREIISSREVRHTFLAHGKTFKELSSWTEAFAAGSKLKTSVKGCNISEDFLVPRRIFCSSLRSFDCIWEHS